MNEEVKSFLNAINYEGANCAFDNMSVDKVRINNRLSTILVYLKTSDVIKKEVIDNLLSNCKDGIKNNNCSIFITYKNENIDFILEEYINCFIDEIVSKRPSFSVLKDYSLTKENEFLLNIESNLSETNIVEINIRLREYLEFYYINSRFSFYQKPIEIKSLQEKIEEHKTIEFKIKENPVVMGKVIEGGVTPLNNVFTDMKNTIIEVEIFDMEVTERPGKRGQIYICSLKITDKTDSYQAKLVKFEEKEFYNITSKLKVGNYYKMLGNFTFDEYIKETVFTPNSIMTIPSKAIKVVDNEPVKRVELHAHTMMSMMDGVIDASSLVKFASSLGHKSVAVTDHNVLQSFPDLYNTVSKINKGKEEDDKFKVLYGAELNVIDVDVDIVFNENDYTFKDQEFIVFDTETTGFYPSKDQMIEIGAVRVKNGEIIDRFDELISCDYPLPKVITDLTQITNEMLKGKDSEENVTKRFLEYIKDTPLVAHNAPFDISFIKSACVKYNLPDFTNTVIDTMNLSRALYPEWRNHKLSTLVKQLGVEWEEGKHHRADYDSEGTSGCFFKMLSVLDNDNIEKLSQVKELVDRDNAIKFARPFHLNVIAQNEVGLKNLFKIISIANTKYLFKGKEPKIPRDELLALKEGLLIGSGCINGEVFSKGVNSSDEDLKTLMQMYDYIEVYPSNVVTHLFGKEGLFKTDEEYYGYVKRLINVAKEIEKVVVATGDVHNLRPDDLISRKIIVSQKQGGRLHPLNRKGMEVPNQYFLTTDEMLDAFSFLPEDLRHEIVVTNTNKIAEQINELKIIRDDLYTPELANSAEITKEMVYKRAKELYGEVLPDNIKERIEAELAGIIGGGFDVIYLIAEKLVKKSNADGYFVGSRGSVGSSLVATLMGITEVNGLPAHYVCPNCKKSIFEINGKPLGEDYNSGYDMPDLDCECGTKMSKEGQDMPFATFLGFKAEKVPDIDLNFSGDNQADAHNYVKELFGEKNAYRAGTISTVASKTAEGYVRAYCEDKGIVLNPAEIKRLSMGCTGVKRTTGQHPGGIIVIPQYMDVFDFTAFQFPADEPDSSWYTTHFDFHAIHDNVLKLDILGHDDPTMLRYLGDETGVDISKITFDDPKVFSLFNSLDTLGLKEEQIMCPTGTLGIPEFGTNFVIKMLMEIKPKKFSDLVKISGLSHGTDVWVGNVRDLIINDVASFDKVVGCRDDIMVSLTNYGMEAPKAFKISEFVRKGRGKKEPDAWLELAQEMRDTDVPEWFIESCRRIQYMFPKAHACAYVMMAYRVAWFKVYYPLYYYSAFFSIRKSDFDVASMLKGEDAIRRKIGEIKAKGFSATNKEQAVADTLNVALEMLARGFTFSNIDIKRSLAKTFVIDEENKTLIVPFMAVDGLGESVAYKIEEEREKKQYYCIEDFATRGKVNKTTIANLRALGVFEGMNESAQGTLF